MKIFLNIVKWHVMTMNKQSSCPLRNALLAAAVSQKLLRIWIVSMQEYATQSLSQLRMSPLLQVLSPLLQVLSPLLQVLSVFSFLPLFACCFTRKKCRFAQDKDNIFTHTHEHHTYFCSMKLLYTAFTSEARFCLLLQIPPRARMWDVAGGTFLLLVFRARVSSVLFYWQDPLLCRFHISPWDVVETFLVPDPRQRLYRRDPRLSVCRPWWNERENNFSFPDRGLAKRSPREQRNLLYHHFFVSRV